MTGSPPTSAPQSAPARKAAWKKIAAPLISLLLLSGAGLLCYHALKDMRWAELWHDLGQMPRWRVAWGLVLTGASYLALTLYDYIGVRYARKRVSYPCTALAAFLAYSISHSLGFPAITGGTVRYRMYSRWGLDAIDVAQIMAMAGITLFLGMFLIGGISLLIDRYEIINWTQFPLFAVIALGIGCLAIVVAYGTMGFIRTRPIRAFSREFQIPGPRFALVQILVSGMDWLIVASVLYVLLPLPGHFTYTSFLGVFVLSYLVGTLSNVPGGLGVFESIILVALTPQLSAGEVVSSLLVYRGIYHLLPLLIGGSTFLFLEFRRPAQQKSR